MKSVIVGTAGHIDHGKTALVRALTGIDADRLEEEKRRGITIDIGFAHMELAAPDGGDILRLGFVDVPGHERFVRNMLAGIGGIDLVLLVIAADESIKPQTREHFDICRLLSIRRGITVLTKSDAVDGETLDVVRMEAEEFVRGSFLDAGRSPIVAVSSKTGAGIDDLKRALARMAAETPAKDASAAFRLPMDRVFSMKGFGTVVTGTLISGAVKKEEELEVFPTGRRVRVRGVQVHGASTNQALAGQRTALNLAAVATNDLARGMMLARPAMFRSTRRADVSLSLLPGAKPLRDRARVHLHAFTAETIAETVLYGNKQVDPGATVFAQLRLAGPMLLLPGDRFILRQFSPVVTIGGGYVIDALPLARKKSSAERTTFLAELADASPEQALLLRARRRQTSGLALADAVAETGWQRAEVEAIASALVKKRELVRIGELLLSPASFEQAKKQTMAAVELFHGSHSLMTGISKEQLREELSFGAEVFAGVLNALANEKRLEISGEQVRAAGRGIVLKDEEAESKQRIEQAFATAGLRVPALKEVLAGLRVDRARAQQIVTLLLREKILVKVSEELVFHRDALAGLRRSLAELKSTSPKIDVGHFKDLTGVTRKYAIPLLEYLDRERVTRRVGDERIIL